MCTICTGWHCSVESKPGSGPDIRKQGNIFWQKSCCWTCCKGGREGESLEPKKLFSIKVLLVIMKISGARNLPRMMISGARNLQSHNEVFWAQKSSFLDDFWGQKSSHIEDFWAQNICRIIMTISGARNHHSNIFDQKMFTLGVFPRCWLSWELL